ncbi:MAG TPA: alpha/beta fold hydrolase [Dokdonella sp.]|uniref:S9 family peptidase n=1 Tax=Dokdonella sp. TaxID=2291710 RepID=UPI002D8000D0|nr:alpha/beta fold hydrolase [Dokdonella sp.]HET9031418.1 alpha/beta fold hydrolase [Dokdonella sp.]
MRVLLLALLLLPVHVMADSLTLEAIFGGGGLDGPVPRELKISPDGSRVTFLRARADDQNRLDLWEYHISDKVTRRLVDADTLDSGAELSDAEKSRRERARIAGLSGIVSYQWSPDGKSLLFPLGGKLYLYTMSATADKAVRELPTDGAFIDPQISPKGGYVSFVQGQNLKVIDLASNEVRSLTTDGGGVIHNAEAEFVAQEEMDRSEGYWWAADDSAIAFERYDESHVAVVKRAEVYADHTEVISQRYPAAGKNNVTVKLGLISPQGGETRWIDLGEDTDIYLVRVKWLPEGKQLSYQLMPRNQQSLELRLVDSATLEQRVLVRESSETWINLNSDLHFLKNDDAFLWASERSGYKQLYLYGLDGKLRHPISSGDWNIDKLLGVDEASGQVYVQSNRDYVPDTQVYGLKLDGSTANTPTRVSKRNGTHTTTFAEDASVYLDSFSNPGTPPQVSLHSADGTRIAWIEENRLDDTHPYAAYRQAHIAPEFGTLKAEDEQTLYYRLYKPAGFDPGKRYPVFIFYYGGPHVQKVVRAWGDLFLEFMAQQGYVVFTLDNRGMDRRGRKFSDVIYRQLGNAEVLDQLTGIHWLKEQPWVDGEHIGVFGWSYGGYMTTMLLSKASAEVAAGVAVAPVTDWTLYDTFYTERYLSTPQDNKAGYIRSAPFAWLDGLSSPLFLIHGMADDNVLFSNSTALMSELQTRGIEFDLMTYPGGKHGLSTTSMKLHAYHAIVNWMDRHLQPSTKNQAEEP